VRCDFGRGSTRFLHGWRRTMCRRCLGAVNSGSRPSCWWRSRCRSLTGNSGRNEQSERGHEVCQEGALQHELTWIMDKRMNEAHGACFGAFINHRV
jgi:hypothetical protein